MIFSIPDVADSYTFGINSVDSLILEKFFADWSQTVQQYTTTTDPAPPLAGDVYLYVKTGLGGFASTFQKQSDGTVTDLAAGGGSQSRWRQNLDSDTFDLDMKTNDIQFGATTRFIRDDAVDNGIAITHPAGEQFNLKWGAALEYHFNETELDLHGNDLLLASGSDII